MDVINLKQTMGPEWIRDQGALTDVTLIDVTVVIIF